MSCVVRVSRQSLVLESDESESRVESLSLSNSVLASTELLRLTRELINTPLQDK
jgi:hypothetical protein